MELIYSEHWLRKKKYRKNIVPADIEYVLMHSDILNDRTWDDVFNGIARVPPSGRILKVVYKRKGKLYKILTTYWLD